MLPLLLHLIGLIYATSSWTGKIANYPNTALCIWVIISIILFFVALPIYVNKKRKAYDENKILELPNFTKTLNCFEWGIVAWISLLQATVDPANIIFPSYKETIEQTLPMIISLSVYLILFKIAMKEFYRLEQPILDPEQTSQDFFRARLTPVILVTPPIILWLLIEDITKGNLKIIHELTLIAYAPLFFLLLFTISPRLFNWAWKSEDSELENLNKEIFLLSEKTQTPIGGIKIWNTFGEPVANAAVAGLSKKYRYVYITKYMTELFSEEQIKAVVGHELGHLKLGHIKTYVLYSIMAILLILLYRIIVYLYFPQFDIENFWYSLIEGIIFVFLFLSSFTALSRYSEHQSDLFSSINTNKDKFIETLTIIDTTTEKKSLLPDWLMLHPTNQKRIQKILELSEINNTKLLQQAQYIRYAMFAMILVLILSSWQIGKPIKQIHSLYKAVQAGNAQLIDKLFNSMPEWLRKHPEVLKLKT